MNRRLAKINEDCQGGCEQSLAIVIVATASPSDVKALKRKCFLPKKVLASDVTSGFRIRLMRGELDEGSSRTNVSSE